MRAMALWCPDWPVHAIRQTAVGAALADSAPIAVVSAGGVYACSAPARALGVRRGLRLRDAQARCPDLITLDHDPGLDQRAFDPVLAIVEDTVPRVQCVRPGLCIFRVEGATRYLGSEPEVAALIAERLAHFGISDTRFGVADGVFAAEQAARRADPGECTVVVEGGDRDFLAGLPVTVLDQNELTGLLRRLGIRTLGDLAGLSQRDVVSRFGPDGAIAHRLARGGDRRTVAARAPVRDFEREQAFEPALTRIDEVAFTLRNTAETFVDGLAAEQLVCTSLWVAIHDESGQVGERLWRHPRWFQAGDVIDRVRWQLAADGSRAGVSTVRLIPEDLAAAADFAEPLWGSGADQRIQRAVSRLQSSLGREAVVSVVLSGGRSPADRAQRSARCQLVAADGSAWLLAVSGGDWRTEARYD